MPIPAQPVPTALIVEDDGEWLRILRDELLGAGFMIDWASDRDEALRKVAAPPFDYDVVFLDPNLGDNLGGLSGIAVVEQLGSRNPGAAVVLVSGYASPEQLSEDYADMDVKVHGIYEKGSFDLAGFRQLVLRLRGVDFPSEALFSCDRASLAAAWDRARTAVTNAEKGEALEALGVELLSGISLLELAGRRVRTPTNEIDAVFRVEAASGTLCQEWGGLLLVECRNREEKFDVGAVSKFAKSLEDRHAKVGIVFSVAGITGDGARDARGQIALEFTRSHRMIIVLDEADIEAVVSAGKNLYDLLSERDMALRLGR